MKTGLDANPLLAVPQSPETQHALKDRQALKKSCQDFEAIFIQSLFKAMRKTVPDNGLFPRDSSSRMYQDMIDQEIATNIARKQSIGLADQMYRQMEKKLPPEK
ncbi:Flagellar protein FlgJ [Desulfobulbus propionicus DSM 2032]|jgi:flagellar protein FlgJ|uniref:Flagellar protein FlgJ n=1 Tax=Desulfobulbus propionicus (strain ATCC 33891 / DSM 2032 / VKM B-1956 / 1pr3) TaxID=577650 RepID=A0A7U3YN16_DESPD|nr:rod-binding protein [Desulfobulbus propionicus]ADW18394.1 Flagellar protein FlgJ [Desulfobulbus propionicus DSM 2032]